MVRLEGVVGAPLARVADIVAAESSRSDVVRGRRRGIADGGASDACGGQQAGRGSAHAATAANLNPVVAACLQVGGSRIGCSAEQTQAGPVRRQRVLGVTGRDQVAVNDHAGGPEDLEELVGGGAVTAGVRGDGSQRSLVAAAVDGTE